MSDRFEPRLRHHEAPPHCSAMDSPESAAALLFFRLQGGGPYPQLIVGGPFVLPGRCLHYQDNHYDFFVLGESDAEDLRGQIEASDSGLFDLPVEPYRPDRHFTMIARAMQRALDAQRADPQTQSQHDGRYVRKSGSGGARW